jgi:hypothetical protein
MQVMLSLSGKTSEDHAGCVGVSAQLFPRVICSRPGILHFSRVLVFQYDHEIVTIGMAKPKSKIPR